MKREAEAAEEVRTTTILDYIVRTDTIAVNEQPSSEMLLDMFNNISEM